MKQDYEKYALIFKALSDETRLKIISMIYDKELCACKILNEFNITQPTLSYHMKTLVDSGIVIAVKEGSWVKYSINQELNNELFDFLSKLLKVK